AAAAVERKLEDGDAELFTQRRGQEGAGVVVGVSAFVCMRDNRLHTFFFDQLAEIGERLRQVAKELLIADAEEVAVVNAGGLQRLLRLQTPHARVKLARAVALPEK